MQKTLFCLALAALFSTTVIVPETHAQEVEKVWGTIASFDQPRPSERAVQLEIEQQFYPWQQEGEFSWEVLAPVILEDKVVYEYGIKSDKLVTTDWAYISLSGAELDTEQELISTVLAEVTATDHPQEPGCPAPTAVLKSPWTVTIHGNAGADGSNTEEESEIVVSYYTYVSDAEPCEIDEGTYSVERTRIAECPNVNRSIMEWSESEGMCVMSAVQREYAFSVIRKYYSSHSNDSCKVGNPCNPTTGEKSQPEPDLELGWISFERHYRSQSTTAGGALGAGWTHSHNVRLTSGTDDTAWPPSAYPSVGLVKENGSHLGFRRQEGYHEAIDGSGDRIVQLADGWKLSRASEQITFDDRGLMQRRDMEDGTSLIYEYDVRRRLARVVHSTGRALEFQYEAAGDDQFISSLSINGERVVNYDFTLDGRLSSVTHIDGGSRVYHYEDARYPTYLTGVTSEDGRRYSWFGYDDKGRVVCSRHS